jgi:hypothetical protein
MLTLQSTEDENKDIGIDSALPRQKAVLLQFVISLAARRMVIFRAYIVFIPLPPHGGPTWLTAASTNIARPAFAKRMNSVSHSTKTLSYRGALRPSKDTRNTIRTAHIPLQNVVRSGRIKDPCPSMCSVDPEPLVKAPISFMYLGDKATPPIILCVFSEMAVQQNGRRSLICLGLLPNPFPGRLVFYQLACGHLPIRPHSPSHRQI